MARILIIAKGSFGDLFPMYALAGRLQADGHRILFATQRRHQRAATACGMPVVLIESGDPGGRPGGNRFAQFLAPDALKEEVDRLLVAARGMDLILGNQLALFGSVVARRLGIPWIYCPVSPLTLPSRFRVSLFPYLHWLQRLTGRSPWLEPIYQGFSRTVSRWALAPVSRQRRRLRPDDRLHPLFEGMQSSVANLLLCSPQLLQSQPDWPVPTRLAGFSWFEPEFLADAARHEALERFLAAGPAPVVFALGGSSRRNPGRFFHDGLRAARALGLRVVVVAGQRFHGQFSEAGDLLVTGHLPYGRLFPAARAVVHSGGIGTIGWCLRFAVPSLLLPSSLDQFDNADLAAQLGYAHLAFERPRRQRAAWLTGRLAALLDDGPQRIRLKMVAPLVASEDGAASASRWITACL